jgi:hypothetical protein
MNTYTCTIQFQFDTYNEATTDRHKKIIADKMVSIINSVLNERNMDECPQLLHDTLQVNEVKETEIDEDEWDALDEPTGQDPDGTIDLGLLPWQK